MLTETVQPDLFGDLDRAEAQRKVDDQPVTCPSCGQTERSGWHLDINHGYRVTPDGMRGIGGFPVGQHPLYGDRCVAQNLAANHIAYAVHVADDARLAVSRARGETLGLDVDAIEAAAREPHTCRDWHRCEVTT